MKKIIVAIGLPGSGKSTMLNRLSKDTGMPIISPDAIRLEMGDSEADQTKNTDVWKRAYEMIAELQASHSVMLFDSTMAQKKDRIHFLETVRKMGIDGIHGIYFQAPFSVVQERNTARGRVVPEYAMLRMHEHLTIDPPDLKESSENHFDTFTVIDSSKGLDVVYQELLRAISGTINRELSPELLKLR
jgi:predicted kinase